MLCLYFICERKFYAHTYVKNTRRWKSALRELTQHDVDGNDNVNKAIGLNQQNNNVAHASRFFVHFFAVTARLRRENA